MGLLKRILGLGRGKSVLLAAGLAASLLVALAYQQQPRFLRHLDLKLFDLMLDRTHSGETSGQVVIVDLDERSLAEFGQWPWPRYRMAMLLEKLAEAGVAAVGLDMLFAESDRTSPATLQAQIKRDLGVDVRFDGLPDILRDNDELLAMVLAQGPFVLGYFFDLRPGDAAVTGAASASLPPVSVAYLQDAGAKGDPKRFLMRPHGAAPPLELFLKAAPRSGFFNANPDSDGIIRRVPLLSNWQENVYPSLGLATLMQALDARNAILKVSSAGCEDIRLGRKVIPVDMHGQLLLNYRGKGRTFPYVSASDVLAARAPAEALEGKVVFIGTSAAGLMDIRATPLDQHYPGVECNATVADNILAGDFITRPDLVPAVEMALVLLSGLLSTLLLLRTGAMLSAVPVVLLSLGYWEGAVQAMAKYRYHISPLYPLLTLLLNYGLLTAIKFWREEKQRRFIHSAFSQYLSPAVVSQIVDSPEKLSLDGEEKEVSILFSDIRGFTSLSEQLSPTQVTNLLHDYFTPMTRIITGNAGTMDKFIGDAIMAFWNAPLDVPCHQLMAVRSAMGMLTRLDELNPGFEEKYGLKVGIGIGLHSGRVRVGNMGSMDLFDYTIIGDSVNLASRLEGLTKYYGVGLVVSETIVQSCAGEAVFQELDSVRVKGKNVPIRIFTAMPMEDAASRRDELEAHAQGLALYKGRDFIAASRVFADLMRLRPASGLYGMYRERCEALLAAPPGDDWDGVYTHKTK